MNLEDGINKLNAHFFFSEFTIPIINLWVKRTSQSGTSVFFIGQLGFVSVSGLADTGTNAGQTNADALHYDCRFGHLPTLR